MNVYGVLSFRDVDFAILDDVDKEKEIVHLTEKHGTVVVTKGLVDEDPDALVCVGFTDEELKKREPVGRVCFYKPIEEIEAILKEAQP